MTDITEFLVFLALVLIAGSGLWWLFERVIPWIVDGEMERADHEVESIIAEWKRQEEQK